jgi:AraC-like DNA-binding protein/mannose-6-phosphate isomerase-like protein (cupin superfamily)
VPCVLGGATVLFNLTYPNYNFGHKYDERPTVDDEYHNHSHLGCEMLLFIGGNAYFVIENKRFELSSGDLLFIAPGQHHNIILDTQTPYERYVVKFPEHDIPEMLLPAFKQLGCFKTNDAMIQALFKRFDSHVETYRGVDLCGLLKCVLIEILYFSCNENSPQLEYKVYKENMIEVINYINRYIEKKLLLEDICKHFHYSKSFICKEFKECMNIPIMQYVRTKKIMLADSLLKKGMKPAKIFEQCGFSDYSTFFRAYKKLFDKAPSYKK